MLIEKHILRFEGGRLHLKLREELNTQALEIHCTLAQVTRDGVRIVKADSRGEVSSTSMRLNEEEMALLVEGWSIVQYYWESELLPYCHVLLNCGCRLDWIKWLKDYGEGLPHIGCNVWCASHEETRVYRFHPDHFTSVEAEELRK